MKHGIKNKSLFVSYFISYLSIVLLSCSLIGLFLCYLSVHDLREANENSMTHKMDLVLKDMENQYAIFEEISSNLYIKPVYRLSYIKRNKYYERDLLEDFARYVNRSSISDTYFMFYRDDPQLFLCTGYSSNYASYFSGRLGVSDSEALYQTINEADTAEIQILPDLDQVLFIFPVHTNFPSQSQDMTICFVATVQSLLSRIRDVSGGIDGSVSLYYSGTLLASESPQGDRALKDTPLEMTAQKTPFRIQVFPWKEGGFISSLLQTVNIICILGFLFLLLGFSCYLAYKNYIPIKRLALKYQENPPSRNELLAIETVVQTALERQKLTSEDLKSKIFLVRQQLLQLILNGEITDHIYEQMETVDLALPGPYYCVFAAACAESADGPRLIGDIEKLSRPDLPVYPLLSADRNHIIILCSLSARTLRDDLAGQLKAVFLAAEYPVHLGRGEIYDSIYKISASYLEAISQFSKKDPVSADPLQYDKELIARMIRAIKVGNDQDAQLYIKIFSNELQLKAPSILLQRYIFSDVLGDLVDAGRQLQCPLSEQQISRILTAHDIDRFCSETTEIIKDLCDKVQYYLYCYRSNTAAEMVRYIDAHCLEYDLTLDRVAAEFGVSLGNASQMIRESTGQLYKDYLIQKRVAHAKRLLLEENLSVAETCSKVGYTSTPHFIKLFKKSVGVTPAVFQKQMKNPAKGDFL